MTQGIDPRVQKMLDEGQHEAVAVFAAMTRVLGDEDPFPGMTDAELASAMLELQDAGFAEYRVDEDGPYIFLPFSEDARPSRRERRQKRRRK